MDPLFWLLGLGFGLGKSIEHIQGLSYIEFMAPGVIASTAMYTATFECTYGTYTRMEPQKTFDSILMTPVTVQDIAAAEMLWAATKAMITSFAILIVMLIIPAHLVKSYWAILIPVVGLFIGLMFSSMALLYTSYTPSYDFFSFFFTLGLTPMFLLSGIFFPLETMPQWVQTASWFMPLTHAVNLTRSLALGWVGPHLLKDAAWIAFVTIILFLLAARRLKKRMEK